MAGTHELGTGGAADATVGWGKAGIEQVAARSLKELGAAVVPRKPLFPAVAKPVAVATSSGETVQVRRPAIEAAEPARTKPAGASHAMRGGPGAWGLTDEAMQVFERIARKPEETIEERCAGLGIDRNREWRARRFLGTGGLIASAGKIGKLEFFALTDKGEAFAAERGISAARHKSGIFHETALRRVMQAAGSSVPGLRFQRGGPINGIQPDALALGREGRRVAVQVSVTNTAAYEAQAALALAASPAIDLVLVVATDGRKVRGIRERLEQPGAAEPQVGEQNANSEDQRENQHRAEHRELDQESEEERQGEQHKPVHADHGKTARGKVLVCEAEDVLAEGFDWAGLFDGGSAESDIQHRCRNPKLGRIRGEREHGRGIGTRRKQKGAKRAGEQQDEKLAERGPEAESQKEAGKNRGGARQSSRGWRSEGWADRRPAESGPEDQGPVGWRTRNAGREQGTRQARHDRHES